MRYAGDVPETCHIYAWDIIVIAICLGYRVSKKKGNPWVCQKIFAGKCTLGVNKYEVLIDAYVNSLKVEKFQSKNIQKFKNL